MENLTKIFNAIDGYKDDMTKLLCELIAHPAVSPADGGTGEKLKAEYLVKKLKELGLGEAKIYKSPDDRSEYGYRPNVVLTINGNTNKRMWFISHMDVVPEGDISLWSTPPFEGVVEDGSVYGRGSNDNGEEIAASIYAAKALKELNIAPQYEICLCFVADEEMGSHHGIEFLIKEGLFGQDDLVYVPDSGNMDGNFIEIAEKSIIWAEFTIIGEQVHASVPERGINACRAANELSYLLDNALHEKFKERDAIFSPPVSTFEPTRRNPNVANVNTVPGKETFCFDCRVLPSVPIAEVERIINETIDFIANKHGVKILLNYLQRNEAPKPTSADAPAVKLLEAAIKKVLSADVTVGGIGGGTCAAFFRKSGIPAVVWGQANDSAHQPDENVSIEHMLNEAKVFALLMSAPEA